jgi:hypothetical protein
MARMQGCLLNYLNYSFPKRRIEHQEATTKRKACREGFVINKS